jgi:hypothetical protein
VCSAQKLEASDHMTSLSTRNRCYQLPPDPAREAEAAALRRAKLAGAPDDDLAERLANSMHAANQARQRAAMERRQRQASCRRVILPRPQSTRRRAASATRRTADRGGGGSEGGSPGPAEGGGPDQLDLTNGTVASDVPLALGFAVGDVIRQRSAGKTHAYKLEEIAPYAA